MQQARTQRAAPSHPIYMQEGLSPKKTAFIIVTVIGCIAILWPKVFYPMMFGGGAPSKTSIKDQRGPGGCCDVVFDREKFLNATPAEIGPQLYRKQMNLYTGELNFHPGLRQERPAHLHPESIYQAMRERGRAIPASMPTVPIVDRKGSPSNPPPRIVEGRPGPIPGMRPPMGAGALHQPQAKGNSMGFIMPLYTIGIIVFFGYTIMKIVFKKPVPNAPYGPAPSDPKFRKDVFGQENGRHVEELNGSKIGTNVHESQSGRLGCSELYNASLATATAASALSTQLKQHSYGLAGNIASNLGGISAHEFNNKQTEQLMEIEKLRKKLEDTERAMAKLIAEMNSDQYQAKQANENTTSTQGDISNGHTTLAQDEPDDIDHSDVADNTNDRRAKDTTQQQQRKKRDTSVDRSVAVLGMEVTASCEGGQKWSGRPPTPVFFSHHEHSKESEDQMPEPQSIYLEGALAHESQILVADSEIKTEEVYDEELNGSLVEPAVVLSSKMTLSLINLDASQENGDTQANHKNEIEIDSPLADDIEIIGDDEK